MKALSSFTLILLIAPAAKAEDWPRWRGPDLNGISKETEWRGQWPKDGPPILWKANVHTGFSSIVVSQGRVLTLGNKDNQDILFCLDAKTGKEQWKHTWKSDLGARFFEGGPTSTPTIDGNDVYVLGRWGDLFCLDLQSGKPRWHKELAKLEMPVPGWGFSGSPLVHGKLLLLNVGESGLALEKSTGKVVWSSAKEESGYSAPFPFTHEGKPAAIFTSGRAYSAVDVATGKVLWEHRWITRYGVNASEPILTGEYVFISTGYGKGATLLKRAKEKPETVWKNRNLRNQMNSSILLDGYLYGVDGDGGTQGTSLKCVELKTGKVLWKAPEVGCGSLIAADGKLIVLSETGELMIAPASPKEFKPQARAKVLDGKCWTVPTLAHGLVYCRNTSGDLVCVDLRKNSSK